MIYVLYHASCRDGFAASYAAWKKFGFGKDIHYMPVRYDNPMPKIRDGSSVYILDFSYKREELVALSKRANVVVLDHHKTAEEDLRGLNFATFDMNKSGAVLAWEYFHPMLDVPELFYMIQDRDLWRWEHKEKSDPVTEALNVYPYNYEVWDELEVNTLLQEGRAIIKFRDSHVSSITRTPMWDNIGGYNVPVVNTGIFVSHTAHAMCDKYPEAKFAACYFDLPGNGEIIKRVWSLRSVGDFDVSAIARTYGGGGHKNAAGFTEENILG